MRLTKQDIADKSGLSIGKVKNYIKLFPDYFPEVELSGRKHPVYEQDAVEVAKLIASMIRKHDHDEIRTALNEAGHNPVMEYVEKPTAIDGSHTTAVIELDALMQIVDVQRDIIEHQKQVIDDLRSQLNEDDS